MKKKLQSLVLGFLFAMTMFLAIAGIVEASGVTFVWNANSETDLAGYRLYQSQKAGTYGDAFVKEIVAGTETVAIENLADGEYFWVVTAFDTHGNESGYSNEVSLEIDTTPPACPGGVTVNITINIKGTL